ncbi:MAG: IPT/TIG domain-containing protein, partial [Methanoregula sp.]|uniref:IPT/TIG domain-containing protein n=1 Tax=Methanoregula sp. TaxID=2052170 RepID=UPI003D0E1CDD
MKFRPLTQRIYAGLVFCLIMTVLFGANVMANSNGSVSNQSVPMTLTGNNSVATVSGQDQLNEIQREVNAEIQNLNTSGFLLPTLKFNETGSAVTLNQGFTINPANNLAPLTVSSNAEKIHSTENGYTIPEGAIIYHNYDNTTRIFDSTGEQQLLINDTASSSIPTPKGFASATRIYQVPSGSVIREKGNVTSVSLNGARILTVIDQKQALTRSPVSPAINGWIETSDNWNAGKIAQFIAYWNVPVSPPSPQWDTVDFLFNAIEPALTGASIVQPVLEWNWGGSGTWTGRAWYVDSSGGYHTNPIYLSNGQTIQGTLSWDNSINMWNITIADLQNRQSETIFSSDNPVTTTNLAAFCTLEAYNVNDNTDMPGSTTFYNMSFSDINNVPVVFPWSTWVDSSAQQTLPGLNVLVNSQSSVTLHTANGGLQPTFASILPVNGTTAGGTVVTITGTGFTGATSVTFGGNAATSVMVVNSTAVTAVTPAGTAGAVNVIITTPGGSATGTNAYTYTATPTASAKVGVFRSSTGTFYLASSNTNGGGTVNAFNYGLPTDTPIRGNWSGQGATVGV